MTRVERYADLARAIRAAPPLLGPVRLVAVDGPAGSGKTTFAGRVATALGGAPVVHVDDLLEGWGDLRLFWGRVERWLLAPLRRGEPGRYRCYDWHAGRFAGDWIDIPPVGVVVFEGVSSARAAIRPELTESVFVTAPRSLRLDRGLQRDGIAMRPEWERWMAEEDAHFAADGTESAVRLVVDGASRVGHDRESEYVRLNWTGARP